MNRVKVGLRGCVVLLVVMLVSTFRMSADETCAADTAYTFRFVADKNMFFVPYGNNGSELSRLLAKIEEYKQEILAGECPLHVDGYCSGDNGGLSALAMAKTRSNRVKSELIQRGGITEECFVTHNYATGDNCVIVRLVPPKAVPEEPVKEEPKAAEPVEAEPEQECSLPESSEPVAEAEEPAPVVTDGGCSLPIALRANLLRWATLTPDLGIEWLISYRWSALVTGTCGSWSWDSKNRKYAVWEVAPEVRYHFNDRVYIGAQYKAGTFNYKFAYTGRQGNIMGGGVTFGYQLPLGSHFAIDFTAAVGCLHVDYEKYYVDGINLIRSDRGVTNWWGPTSLGVTLVYNFK